MLTLLLAPLSGVLAAICYCDDGFAGPSEIAPFSCCEETHRCCYDRNEGQEEIPVVADLSQQNRADFKVAVRQINQVLAAPVFVDVRKDGLIFGADSGGMNASGRSLRQSWLI